MGDAGGRGQNSIKIESETTFSMYTKEAHASYVIEDGRLNCHMTDYKANNDCSLVTRFALLLHMLASMNHVIPGKLVHSLHGTMVPSDFVIAM